MHLSDLSPWYLALRTQQHLLWTSACSRKGNSVTKNYKRAGGKIQWNTKALFPKQKRPGITRKRRLRDYQSTQGELQCLDLNPGSTGCPCVASAVSAAAPLGRLESAGREPSTWARAAGTWHRTLLQHSQESHHCYYCYHCSPSCPFNSRKTNAGEVGEKPTWGIIHPRKPADKALAAF